MKVKRFMKGIMPFALATAMVATSPAVSMVGVLADDSETVEVNFSYVNNSSVEVEEVSGTDLSSAYSVDGTGVTIQASGTYTFSGTCTEGYIKVKKGITGVVINLEDGFDLSSSETAPIVLGKTSEATISVNGNVSLTDLENPANEDSTDPDVADAFEGAAIKVKSSASLTITGSGYLNIDGNDCKNGIKGGEKATVTISDLGFMSVYAAKNGISCDGILNAQNTYLCVCSGEKGFSSDPDITDDTITPDTYDYGIVTINNTELSVYSSEEAIYGYKSVNMNGVHLHIESADKGVETEGSLVLDGGSDVDITSAKKGFSGDSVEIYDSELRISSEAKSIDATSLTVDAGYIVCQFNDTSAKGTSAITYDDFAFKSGEIFMSDSNLSGTTVYPDNYIEFLGSDTTGTTGTDYITTVDNYIRIYDKNNESEIFNTRSTADATHVVYIKDEGLSDDTTYTLSNEEAATDPSVQYRVQVQKTGWEEEFVSDGTTSGTVGKKLRLEAIQIKLAGVNSLYGGVEYRTHIQKTGWEEEYAQDGATSGTVGKKLRLEAIQIGLYGDIADDYAIYYRVQAQKFGWLGWAMNGDYAGTAGYAYRLEGIQIVLVEKDEDGYTKAPSECDGVATVEDKDAYYDKNDVPTVYYKTQVQSYGWQSYVTNGATSGTVGKAKRLEAIKIKVDAEEYGDGGIEYRTHVQKKGWQSWVADDALSGTVGKSLRLEAIQINLTGAIAEEYDVYYRVQAQTFGWMGWAKNGASAGTAGYGYRLEAIQIRIVKKGTPSGVVGSTSNAFRSK